MEKDRKQEENNCVINYTFRNTYIIKGDINRTSSTRFIKQELYEFLEVTQDIENDQDHLHYSTQPYPRRVMNNCQLY